MAGGIGDPELAERSKIYFTAGTWDPTVTATLAPQGSMYLRIGVSGGNIYQKLDDGKTTNWVLNNTSGGGGGSIPVTQNIYVEQNGSDLTGDGSRSNPVQTMNKALSLCTNPAAIYSIMPGTGEYSGADLTWLPNVNLIGNGMPTIHNNINYTSPAGSTLGFTFQNVNVDGLITLDFSLAAIAIHTFTTGSFKFNRIDSQPVGPWVMLISDATLGDSSFCSSCILDNILFVSSMDIKDGGRVLAGNCPLGIPITMAGNASISLQSCNTAGAVFTGTPSGGFTPTIVTDIAALTGATYTDCNVFYGNQNGTLIIGEALDSGVLTASATGSTVSGKSEIVDSEISSTQIGADARGYALSGGKILSSGGASSARGEAAGVNSKIQSQGAGSSASGSVSNGSEINATGSGSKAGGYASDNGPGTSAGKIIASGEGSLALGEVAGGDVTALAGGSVSFGAIYNGSTVPSLISSLQEGALAHGYIESFGSGNASTNSISALNSGAGVFGSIICSTANNQSVNQISNGGNGSFVLGSIRSASTNALGPVTNQNIISSSADSCFVLGYITTTANHDTTVNTIKAEGFSSVVFGQIDARRQHDSSVNTISSTAGIAHGFIRVNANLSANINTISCQGVGSDAGGFIGGSTGNAQATITVTGSGSLARGAILIPDGTVATIAANGSGCLALGNITNGSVGAQREIIADGSASFAMGTMTTNDPSTSSIKTLATGAFAFGYIDNTFNGKSVIVDNGGYGSMLFGADLYSNTPFTFLFGAGHVSNEQYQLLCGSYSDIALNPIFAVGNGVSGTPSNSFEVRNDGAYKTSGTQTRKVRTISAFPYTIDSISPDDVVIAVTSAPTDEVFLPAAPVEGKYYTVVTDSSSTDNLIINGNGNNIAGSPTDLLGINDNMKFIFGNGQWQKI